ncbi:MAG: DNA adenine methylase [Treponema sp.]|nr:DNA adenine methylase [Treponema sp.]
MKTPLSYYGGKQQLASRILELIPEHRIYCEPFIGGAAVFFAKEPSPVEVINDTNGELINFYEVVQQDFPALKKEIQISLYSRKQHRHAEVIYNNPEMFDRIKRAWAIWMLANGSYGNKLTGGYAYGRTHSKTMANKRARFFVDDYAARLRQVQIECYDALRIIASRDTEDTFFYLDPPYVGTNQGHYDGYTQDDFDALLTLLEKLNGKFLLSSFRNKSLAEFSERNKWHTLEFKMGSSMTHSSKAPRTKIEVLTANYPIVSKNGPKNLKT